MDYTISNVLLLPKNQKQSKNIVPLWAVSDTATGEDIASSVDGAAAESFVGELVSISGPSSSKQQHQVADRKQRFDDVCLEAMSQTTRVRNNKRRTKSKNRQHNGSKSTGQDKLTDSLISADSHLLQQVNNAATLNDL